VPLPPWRKLSSLLSKWHLAWGRPLSPRLNRWLEGFLLGQEDGQLFRASQPLLASSELISTRPGRVPTICEKMEKTGGSFRHDLSCVAWTIACIHCLRVARLACFFCLQPRFISDFFNMHLPGLSIFKAFDWILSVHVSSICAVIVGWKTRSWGIKGVPFAWALPFVQAACRVYGMNAWQCMRACPSFCIVELCQ